MSLGDAKLTNARKEDTVQRFEQQCKELECSTKIVIETSIRAREVCRLMHWDPRRVLVEAIKTPASFSSYPEIAAAAQAYNNMHRAIRQIMHEQNICYDHLRFVWEPSIKGAEQQVNKFSPLSLCTP